MSLTICKGVVQNNAGHSTKYGIGYYALVPVKPQKYKASALIKNNSRVR
jgi:hypothetical protein